ncbi:MAG: hypothetical protein ACP5SA_01075 [Candidatus Micrarchaeia archaeon]
MVVDTSSILFGIESKKDALEIAGEIGRVVLPKGVIIELEKIAKGHGSKGACAKTALEIIRQKRQIKIIASRGNADSWILKNAPRLGAFVVTNDTALARKLEMEGIRVFKLARSGKLRSFV